jgi:hypothetical protein
MQKNAASPPERFGEAGEFKGCVVKNAMRNIIILFAIFIIAISFYSNEWEMTHNDYNALPRLLSRG